MAKQPSLGRAEATCAALIPIRKNPSWWGLSQDERRKIFEEQSRHIHIGLQYLPAVARRLHHCRDLGENEPFDFLNWFEYSPSDETAFNRLLAELRASVEWQRDQLRFLHAVHVLAKHLEPRHSVMLRPLCEWRVSSSEPLTPITRQDLEGHDCRPVVVVVVLTELAPGSCLHASFVSFLAKKGKAKASH